MLEYNIRIIVIKSSSLRAEGDIGTLIKFAEIIRKMNHLEEFDFDCEDFEDENAPPMELLTDLPFRYLHSYQFKIFGKVDVLMMVLTISKIKYLQGDHKNFYRCKGFQLKRNFVSDYLLTPDDFKLLINLPLTYVDLHALDLTKGNIKEFGEIMKQMKILEIEYDDELFQNEDFEIDVEEFGPGGIYKTIIDKSAK